MCQFKYLMTIAIAIGFGLANTKVASGVLPQRLLLDLSLVSRLSPSQRAFLRRSPENEANCIWTSSGHLNE